jgi:hypothetical protein
MRHPSKMHAKCMQTATLNPSIFWAIQADVRFAFYNFAPAMYEYVTARLRKPLVLVLTKVFPCQPQSGSCSLV